MAEGDRSDDFYVVASGELAVHVSDKVVGTLRTGDCMGEMDYLADEARSASVVSQTDATLLKVSAALIDWASIPRQMRFNKAFTRVLIRRLAETSQRLASYLE
tara:strand:+ start:135 stop:443 length:309 start_codon:yes stop_codon:yes gene_type:complete